MHFKLTGELIAAIALAELEKQMEGQPSPAALMRLYKALGL